MADLFEQNRNYVLGDPDLDLIGGRAKLAQWRGPQRLGGGQSVRPERSGGRLMARRVPYTRIKSNRSYTFEEAAEVLGVATRTVRRWARVEGMPYLSDQRPFLILGWAMKDFLKGRDRPRGRGLKPTEFQCLTCKAPREPLGGMADYIPINAKRARLQALCSTCGGVCNRFVSSARMTEFAQIFDLQINNGGDD